MHCLLDFILEWYCADRLDPMDSKCQLLTQVLHQKTQGNPFFLIQLLRSLYENDVLRFNPSNGTCAQNVFLW